MLRTGIVLILLSFLPWLVLPAVPWLAKGLSQQATLAGGLVALGEILFWPGLALAGKDAWRAAKSHGWRGALPELLRRFRAGS
jgi:hypothetical protein